jgi:hypothetical protein
MRDIPQKEWVGIYRKYFQTRGPQKTGGCAELGEIASFFSHRTSRKKKYRLLRHIFDCETCRNEFDWLRDLNLRAVSLGEDVKRLNQVSRSNFLLKRWSWIGIGAATLTISLFLIVPAHRISPKSGAVYRESAQLQFRDVVPYLGGVVTRANLHFSWKTPLPGGSFIFELYDPALALIWRSPTIAETAIRIPENILRILREDQLYYWSISGTWDDKSFIESPLFSFRIGR